MEYQDTEAPEICPERRYVVALTFTNSQIIDVVLTGRLIQIIRDALQRQIPERHGSIFFEVDGYEYFVPTSSIAYMIVSKTIIIEDEESQA